MLTLEHLADLQRTFQKATEARVREFTLGHKTFQFNSSPAIMGVVNLSTDSWYRESVCFSVERTVQRGQVLAAQGADLVDLGAESTLARAKRLTEGEQKSKLIPVLQGLARSGVLVSVETYEPNVAEAALDAGAQVLNLTGPAHAGRIYRMVAERQAAVIICYVQGQNVRSVGNFELAADPVAGMREFFAREIDAAVHCGVEKILIDPGLGFYYENLQDSAARVRFQMQIFLNTFRLRELGYPVCHALPHAFEYFGEEVRSAEPFFAVLAALGKTDLFRTHEVPRIKAVLETLRLYGATG